MQSEAHRPIENDVIQIRNPKKLGAGPLAAERIAVSATGEYKPCIAKTRDDGRSWSTIFPMSNRFPSTCIVHRMGRTWSGPDKTAIAPGEEPYLSRLKEGALLLTGGGNCWGSRSEDDGRTWARELKPFEFASKVAGFLSRNILELNDGSLLAIVDVPGKGKPVQYGNEFVARSPDQGRTWPEVYPLRVESVPAGYPWSIFEEAYLWQARSGKLYAIARVDHRRYRLAGRKLSNLEMASVACSLFHWGYHLVKDISETEIDHLNHLKIFSFDRLGQNLAGGPGPWRLRHHVPVNTEVAGWKTTVNLHVPLHRSPLGSARRGGLRERRRI